MRLVYGIIAFVTAAVLAFLFHLLMRGGVPKEEPPPSAASYLPPQPESYGAFRARTAAAPSADGNPKRSDPPGPESGGRVA